MEKGTYLDTPIKEYRAWPGISYSRLAAFNESQDHALVEVPAKSFFEFGNAFELIIEDKAKGTNKFSGIFFICNAPGTMPADLAEWIKSGEDLNSKYRLTNSGERNKQSKRLHAWLDECQANPGKMPMGKDEVEMLKIMTDNFMKMEVFGHPLSDILPSADFQVPIVWYHGKMRKKALIDCMVEVGQNLFAFDIKTAADMKRFGWMFKDKYWIQEVHYSAGLRSIFPDHEIDWLFLVSSKQNPYISQSFCLDGRSRENAEDVYSALCKNFDEWNSDGRPPKGWLGLEEIKVWF